MSGQVGGAGTTQRAGLDTGVDAASGTAAIDHHLDEARMTVPGETVSSGPQARATR